MDIGIVMKEIKLYLVRIPTYLFIYTKLQSANLHGESQVIQHDLYASKTITFEIGKWGYHPFYFAFVFTLDIIIELFILTQATTVNKFCQRKR